MTLFWCVLLLLLLERLIARPRANLGDKVHDEEQQDAQDDQIGDQQENVDQREVLAVAAVLLNAALLVPVGHLELLHQLEEGLQRTERRAARQVHLLPGALWQREGVGVLEGAAAAAAAAAAGQVVVLVLQQGHGLVHVLDGDKVARVGAGTGGHVAAIADQLVQLKEERRAVGNEDAVPEVQRPEEGGHLGVVRGEEHQLVLVGVLHVSNGPLLVKGIGQGGQQLTGADALNQPRVPLVVPAGVAEDLQLADHLHLALLCPVEAAGH